MIDMVLLKEESIVPEDSPEEELAKVFWWKKEISYQASKRLAGNTERDQFTIKNEEDWIQYFGLQNQERRVGKMTYKELLWLQYPEFASPQYRGGCRSCPSTYGYEAPEDYEDHADCSKCWDREIPDKVIAVAVRGGKSLGGTHYRPGEEF